MTANEEHLFEVDLIVRAAGQPDARISREYTSVDAASTDKAATEIFGAIDAKTRARMVGVNDQD